VAGGRGILASDAHNAVVACPAFGCRDWKRKCPGGQKAAEPKGMPAAMNGKIGDGLMPADSESKADHRP
jgi:hypothetical protein